VRFTPGTYNGAPVAVAVGLTVSLNACVKQTSSADGSVQPEWALRSIPVISLNTLQASYGVDSRSLGGAPSNPADPSGLYKVGSDVSAPVSTNLPEAKYSDYAKKKKITGTCIVGLIVDVNGVPQNVHLVKSLEPSLDQKAIEAVKNYRFKPALKDGTTPVPVKVNVEVNFRLY
jgi:TonB family protein